MKPLTKEQHQEVMDWIATHDILDIPLVSWAWHGMTWNFYIRCKKADFVECLFESGFTVMGNHIISGPDKLQV